MDLRRLEDMLTALQQGDTKVFERLLRRVVMEVMSYHDLAGEPEKVYQALVLGMLVWLSGSYEIRTNRESGYGHYDILLKPKTSDKLGIILEFKQVYEGEKPETVLARFPIMADGEASPVLTARSTREDKSEEADTPLR